MIELLYTIVVVGYIIGYFVHVGKRMKERPEENREEAKKKVRDLLDRMKRKREEGKDIK